LISFAECFGASRLMKACTQFIDLWRQKHETGQWIEVEPETMSARSEFPPFNAAGIMFMGDKETMSVSNGDANGEDAARADYRTPQHPHGPYQSAYPPWAMHPPYPMQGMPYYPGVNPYYPPPYPPMDDPRYNHSERRPSRKHSSDSKDLENSDDESDQTSSERESSHGRKSSKKGKRSSKKKSNVIVIRNVNVRSKKHGSSESESQTGSDVASEDSDDSHTKYSKRNHKRSSSKKKGGKKIIVESEHEYKDEMSRGQDGDQGNWNAFQNFLLRDEEKTRDNDADMFASEKEPPPPRRKESRIMDDPILLSERGSADIDERNPVSFSSANGRIRARQMMSGDELMMSGEGRGFVDGDIKEIEAGGGGYMRGAGDDFMVYGQDNSMDRGSSLDPLAEAHYRRPALEEKSVRTVADESFMIPVRSSSQDNLGAENRTAIDIDVELPTTAQKASDAKAGGQLFYEPDELMPEREVEDVSFGYDPTMDYDSHMQIQPDTTVENADVEDSSLCVEDEEKVPGKDKKLRSSQDGKRRMDASARRLSSSKGPLTDAQKRAQNLRAYKADLQKEKKEQEAEQIKRLERLKQERQKRISARSGASNPVSTPQQAKAKPSPKISPSTYKSSKFSDAEPGSSSPLRKLPARSTPGSDPQKTAKVSKLGDNNSNAVSKSTSSLTETIKKEKSGRTESSSERLKKLAEPKSNAPADHPPSSKSAIADHPRRRSMPEDVQTKKISAIIQLDQIKSAVLPELKVKSPRAPAAVVKNKTVAKETKEGSRGAKSHPTSESSGGKKANGKLSRASDSDENVVVEKTVVMLENEVVSTPPVILPAGSIAENKTSSDDRTENPSLESEYTAIRAPPSPVVLPGDVSPTIHTSENELDSYKVDVPEYQKDELEKPTSAPMEKPYEAPFARVTSLEGSAPAYHHPLPARETEALVRVQSVRARIPEPEYVPSAEETHEENEMPRSKEPKGFRKLLKFGRKSHASAMDSDASSVDEAPAGDGSMLKNLISQDDSAGPSSKASRSFSLLSPFRKNKVIVL